MRSEFIYAIVPGNDIKFRVITKLTKIIEPKQLIGVLGRFTFGAAY